MERNYDNCVCVYDGDGRAEYVCDLCYRENILCEHIGELNVFDKKHERSGITGLICCLYDNSISNSCKFYIYEAAKTIMKYKEAGL
jgi:hypothetical protein